MKCTNTFSNGTSNRSETCPMCLLCLISSLHSFPTVIPIFFPYFFCGGKIRLCRRGFHWANLSIILSEVMESRVHQLTWWPSHWACLCPQYSLTMCTDGVTSKIEMKCLHLHIYESEISRCKGPDRIIDFTDILHHCTGCFSWVSLYG